MGSGGGGGGGARWIKLVDVKFWTFAGGRGYQNEISAKKGRGWFQILSLCENEIIEWPLMLVI